MKQFFILMLIMLDLSNLSSAKATSLLPLSLEQLSSRASLIFYGTAVSNQVKLDDQSGRVATFTTFNLLRL